jgi:hypothetical protein
MVLRRQEELVEAQDLAEVQSLSCLERWGLKVAVEESPGLREP